MTKRPAPPFVIRHGTTADRPLVFDSWAKGAHEAQPTNLIPTQLYSPRQAQHIEACLLRARVLVAAHPDDPAEAIGYVVHEHVRERLVVHWIYVARPWRRRGMAAHLLEAASWAAGDPIIFTQPSKHLSWIRPRVRVVYDPYLLSAVL